MPLLRKRAREPGDLEGEVDAVNAVEVTGEVVAKAEVSGPILYTPHMEIREVPRLDRKNMRSRSHLVLFVLQKKATKPSLYWRLPVDQSCQYIRPPHIFAKLVPGLFKTKNSGRT